MSDPEQILWKGTPSHVRNLPYYAVCALLAPLVVPVALAVWRFLETVNHRITVTNERIQVTTGVLSKRMREVELYRVKDSSLEQPFFLRLFRLARIHVATSDDSMPSVVVGPLKRAAVVRENLRGSVEKARERKLVREIDYA